MSAQKKSIKAAILRPIIYGFSIFLVISVIAGLWLRYSNFQTQSELHLHDVNRALENQLSIHRQMISTLAAFAQRDPRIMSTWQSQNREQLYQYTSEIFREFETSRTITHFYFLDTDGKVLLRVHDKDRHSDIITRKTFQQAKALGKAVSGIELGVFGTLTLRHVLPIKTGSTLVGFIEMGVELDHIAHDIASILNTDISIIVDKNKLQREQWEIGKAFLGHSDEWDTLPDHITVHAHEFTTKLVREGVVQQVLKNETANVYRVDDSFYQIVRYCELTYCVFCYFTRCNIG